MAWFKLQFGRGSAGSFRVRRGVQDLGTFELREFLEWLERGNFDPTDEVLIEGSQQWVPISQIQTSTARKIHFKLGDALPAPGPIGHPPDAAELSPVGPATRAGPPPPPMDLHASRRRGRRFSFPLLSIPLISIGSISGGALLAAMILGFYIWGTLDMNRRGAEEQAVEALRGKVVRYVEQHPQFTASTAGDILSAPILDEKDRKLIRSARLIIHPVDARSPAEALVITRPVSGGERRYYKGCKTNFVMSWAAPTGNVAVMSAPQSPSNNIRIIRIDRTDDGRTLAEYQVEAFSVTTQWRRDGKMVAINESAPGGRIRFSVFEVTDHSARRMGVPDELTPAGHLRPEDASGELRWLSDQSSANRWLPSGDLEAETFGNVMLVGDDRLPSLYIVFRKRFTLSGGADGAMHVISRETVNYDRSKPKGTLRPVPERSTRE